MSISGRVDGVEQLTSSLGDAARQLEDLTHVDDQVGRDVLGVVRPPRVSGALANTIRAEPDGAGVTLVAGSPTVLYAGPIHNGWPAHHITAQPFLTKAIDQQVEKIADRYEDHATEALSTIKGV